MVPAELQQQRPGEYFFGHTDHDQGTFRNDQGRDRLPGQDHLGHVQTRRTARQDLLRRAASQAGIELPHRVEGRPSENGGMVPQGAQGRDGPALAG